MNGEEMIVVDDSNGLEAPEESSTSGSSDSGSSSSGEESSTSSSAESTSRSSSLWREDDIGEYLPVTCAENEAKFYKSRFARGSVGRCVRFKGRWITPNEFQAVSGRQSSKDWKRSIRLNGRCLKEYIGEGLFKEHPKACSCRTCLGEDEDLKRQEGVMALAAKRRRLSQAGMDASHSSNSSGPSHAHLFTNHETNGPPRDGGGASGGTGAESGDSDEEGGGGRKGEEEVEGTAVRKLPGTGVKRKRRGRPPKNQKAWSPPATQDPSSNEEEYRPSKIPNLIPENDSTDTIIDASDFLPRRSARASNCKPTGYRTELGTYPNRPIDWDAEEVAEFMKLQGFAEYADSFQENDMNGQSLFLLQEHHLLDKFSMKLGPTLRLLDTISRLRHPPNLPNT